MKTWTILLALVSSSVFADFQGKVIAIADGDTITVLTAERQQIKVRLANIDAPEKSQPFGTKARTFTSDLIYNKQVHIQEAGKDQYSRVIGTVFLGNTNINKTIVRNGYAWAYRRYLTDSSYIALENEARANKRGLWLDKNPIPPYNWRKKSPCSTQVMTC